MLNEKYIKDIKHGGFRSFIKKAIELGIDVRPLPASPLILKLVHNNKTIFAHKGRIPLPKRTGNFTTNKNTTKILLNSLGIRTPQGIMAKNYLEAIPLVKKACLTYPLIVKPLDDSLATGVSWNIKTSSELKKAVSFFEKTKITQKSKFLVEEMYVGDEFRVLVFNGKILSCIKKIPATLIGDGKSTIKELAKIFDDTRTKGFGIKFDKIALATISQNGFNINSVLPRGYALKLRNNLNMSDGGRSIECTKEMSTRLQKICLHAIEAMGLTYGGIDIITKNIATKKNDYVILEINSSPYYNMHEKPLVEGKGVDVSEKILKVLFPDLKIKD